LAFACGGESSSPGGPNQTACDSSPRAGLSSTDGCKVVATAEVTPQAARDLGFRVDRDLALLDRTHQASFHRGDFACGAPPGVDGQISIRATLQSIEHRRRAPVHESIPASACPDFLIYHCGVELNTNEGSVSGRFDGEAYSGVDSVHISAGPEPAQFAGTLGIRVDRNRPREGVVAISITLREAGPAGQVFTAVNYTDCGDPLQHQGEGGFWPTDNSQIQCGWLEVPYPEFPMVSLDEYNHL